MNVKIASIELDASIQCRAVIDTAVVNDYAERMTEGDKFPPIELYGTKDQCWIGDGWHRVMAAKQIGAVDIPANLHAGNRVEALKHALGANALHGHRRSNNDKRRCVELALKEFAKMSNRMIADMCGVGHTIVDEFRKYGMETGEGFCRRKGQMASDANSTRTGKDGKEYPTQRKQSADKEPTDKGGEQEPKEKSRKLGPPCNGMQFARMAIMDLEQIKPNDLERTEAFNTIKGWIKENEN